MRWTDGAAQMRYHNSYERRLRSSGALLKNNFNCSVTRCGERPMRREGAGLSRRVTANHRRRRAEPSNPKCCEGIGSTRCCVREKCDNTSERHACLTAFARGLALTSLLHLLSLPRRPRRPPHPRARRLRTLSGGGKNR
ncbi:hypothetical protein EVAR_93072_1 [Eumeta japonica]|uniref:Uncharacterized protein n=1 Tax=Eumeta variegata TaxID=151549 RepID=A0A4C1TG70_EUMVA|nr:hypothetical protein EVAR_93072_1 [Eumeta japonica]